MESESDAFQTAPRSAEEVPVLSAQYLAAISWVESLPENQSGADKTWIEEAVRASAAHWERAVRVR